MFESTSTQNPSPLIAAIDTIKDRRWQGAPDWLSAVREKGRALFEQKGLPNRHQEEWKYTDVSDISRQGFLPPAPVQLEQTAIDDLKTRLDVELPDLSPMRMVFINGFYSPALSRLNDLPDGIEATSMADALTGDHPLLQKHLATHASTTENSFVALNNAFIEDGAFVYIPAGTTLTYPLHLVYVTADSKEKKAAVHHPRNLVVAEAGAAVTIIEDYIGDSRRSAVYLSNPVTEIVVGEGAGVEHYKLQQESDNAFHIATIQAVQEKSSHFSSHSISLGGRLTRNTINSDLRGSGSTCTFNGLYMIKNEQHVDNHTLIYHGSPGCHSSELYHGILDDKARGVFNGKIYVEPGAQKTDSQQTNRALMLSDDARMDAKPQLEIYADDVKCTHGATVGRLDADALYYLRSRGIETEDARKMLTLAFGQQVTDLIKLPPLRDAMASLIARRLQGAASEV